MTVNKIDKYLVGETEYRGSYDDGEYLDSDEYTLDYDTDDDELMSLMADFLMTIDPDILDDDQLDMYMEIMDEFDGDEDDDFVGVLDDTEEVEEAAAIRKRRDKGARRERKKEYRREKAKVKQSAKRWRKTAEYKKYQRKKKMMSKQGRTARGKRIKKFVE